MGGGAVGLVSRLAGPAGALAYTGGLNEGEQAELDKKWAGVTPGMIESLQTQNKNDVPPGMLTLRPEETMMRAEDWNRAMAGTREAAQASARSDFLRSDKDTRPVVDYTSQLASVPKELPEGLREGVVYRTKGANGETVFSGRNVKEGADYVSGMGDRTGTLGERGNLTVVPKEAFTMTSPGMDERIGSALRAAADRGDFAAIRNYYAQQDRQAAAAAGGEAGAPQMPDTTGMTRTRAERTLRNWENQMTAYNSRMDRAATREANAAKTAFEIAKFNVEQGNKQFENKIKANQELRAQFGDIKKSLMPLFQSPELKDGKPTGKSVDDDAAFGKFQSEVVAKLGPQAAASLTASEWSSLASQYKTNAAAIERFGQGQTVVDPSLRQLGARESRLTDVLSPRFGITDYLAGAFSGSKSPRNYVVTDPNTGTIAYAPDVFGGTGDRPLNVREVQAVSPELAAKIGLRNP
jgi:hypothetical protein